MLKYTVKFKEKINFLKRILPCFLPFVPFKFFCKGYCCAEFIKEFGRVLADYNMPCRECPFHYQSNTALKCKIF